MNKVQKKYHWLGLVATLFGSLAAAESVIQSADTWSDLLAQSTTTQCYSAPSGEMTAILRQVRYPSLATLAQPSKSLAGEIFYIPKINEDAGRRQGREALEPRQTM